MRKLLILVVLFSNVLSFSQNGKILSDKEYYSLQEESRRLLNSDRDSCFILASEIEKSRNFLHKAFALGVKSYLFQLNGDSIQSKKFYRKALDYLNGEKKDSNEKLKTKSFLINIDGLSKWNRGRLSAAIDSYDEGLKISKALNDKLQIIKFSNNKAIIFGDLNKHKEAIRFLKKTMRFIDLNVSNIDESQFTHAKSQNYFLLGLNYQESYLLEKNNKKLLDSSFYFYRKSLIYSKNILINYVNSNKGLAVNYILLKKYDEALKRYNDALLLATEKKMNTEICNIFYNIGYINFEKKDFLKSLIYFKKVDSIHNLHKINLKDYINSNYFQCLIHEKRKDYKNAEIHSKIFLKEYEKNEESLNIQVSDLNDKLFYKDVKNEMIVFQNKYESIKNRELIIKFIIGIIIIVLIFFLLKSLADKKNIMAKVDKLIEEAKIKNNYNSSPDDVNIQKRQVQISLDEEEEIIKKIYKINEKQEFLKQEFNQQYLAKKLKTNTTYLSYIFNKIYNKTFSSYYNELRLEFVINEILNNKTYREYSTQAIAESAGFKNADSFTVSFKKKTGLTPFQFVNEIKKREIF